ASGIIKHYGFSFHDSFPVFKEIIDYHDWDMVQIQYNYMDAETQATTEGLKYAASKGMAVVIMEPLKGGALANPPSRVKKIFSRSGSNRTPVDWALQFLWNKPEISCVLSGMSNMQQVRENIASASNSGINSLLPDEEQILNEVAEIFKKAILIPCSGCEYCLEACQNGVAIPKIFQILNDYSRTKNEKKAKKNYRKLISSPRKISKGKNNGMASLCIKCKKCVEKCPQKIDIPTELEKAHAILSLGKSIEDEYS
ncbi:MAG: aldo/keto reductase, partial [Promethearchaeota archaeon]